MAYFSKFVSIGDSSFASSFFVHYLVRPFSKDRFL